jgi:hypothetical protein
MKNVPGKEAPAEMPEFVMPEPSRLQRAALKAAGGLLGISKQDRSDPAAIAEAVAVQIGGYQKRDLSGSALFPGADSEPAKYTHPKALPELRTDLHDDTTPRGVVRHNKSEKYTIHDWEDSRGASVEQAFARTVNGVRNRDTGERAKTLRGRLARKLATFATKGNHRIDSF